MFNANKSAKQLIDALEQAIVESKENGTKSTADICKPMPIEYQDDISYLANANVAATSAAMD
jgi:hypothetical protein